MRDAIATVEIFARPASGKGAGLQPRDLQSETGAGSGGARRLTLVISKPERDREGRGWLCRLSLANLHRPMTISAPDSVLVLERALAQARAWLAELEASGLALWRDRDGTMPFVLE